MRALAEWIMRGRTQAVIATVALLSLPLIFVQADIGNVQVMLDMLATVMVAFGAAAVGLVTLRQGPGAGIVPLLWGIIPALLWLTWLGEASPLVILLGVLLAATVLRQTVSWAQTLALATIAGLVAAQVVELFAPGAVTAIGDMAERFVSALAEQQPQSAELVNADMLRELLLGGLVAGHIGSTLMSLALARWWQALLYNPGGFREEFHQLRLGPLFAGGFILVMVLGVGVTEGAFRWLPVLILPFMIAGVALVHAVVAKRELGRSWLIAFYTGAFVAGPYLISLLILLAVADSFLHIRKRIPART
ncbi:hypothetical protein [Motiliproteus sp. SC1-56]|uniref:hypothetical protein n=1 Tax=Motiliproteus sp. SC1-56 TaxID=2799565 RepID=UPI001A8D3CA6|nr:hypothetical protein [Motiliproteus sp. SC1-56]